PPHREPFGAQLADQPGETRKRAAARPQLLDLRADMHGEPDRLDPRQICRQPIGGDRVAAGDPELVALAPGRDAGMAAGIDIGVDPDRDPRGAARIPRDGAEPAQLRYRLDVDLMDVAGDGEIQLGAGLADT